MSEGKFDSHRRLCPDGGCIGVIGDDGKCRVCGREASGGAKSAAPGDAPAVEDEDADADDFGDGNEDADGGTEEKAAAGAGFDPGRKLCPDDSCIGVIGPEGVCTVCGKKAD